MIEWLKKQFFAEEQGPEKEPDVNLAAAALMLEVAKSDFETDDDELQQIINNLKPLFHLSDETANALLAEAKTHTTAATDLHGYTRLINEHYDRPQKFQLLTLMWQVALSDGALHKYEDSLIRKVSDLIHLGHSDFIRSKKAAQDLHPDHKLL